MNHAMPPMKAANIVPHLMNHKVSRMVRYKLDKARYAVRITIIGGINFSAVQVEGGVDKKDSSAVLKARMYEQVVMKTE